MNNIMLQINTVVNNQYLYILLLFTLFDIITGTLKAFSNNTVYSKTNKHGITNHITLILFCIFFTFVFSILNANEYSDILLMFYIVSYGLSIIENVGAMGIPIPKWLKDKFISLQEETNKGVESNETKRNK